MESTWRNHKFPTTRWSIISLARGDDDEQAQRAYGELIKIYWMPLYALARFKKWSPEDAADAVQDFLMGLGKQGFFEKADKDRGQLRTFLRTCFENHIYSLARKSMSQKRGGGVEILSLDYAIAENALGDLNSTGSDPTSFFDRQWALALLRHVLDELEESYAKRGREEIFSALSPFLKIDADKETSKEIAERLGKTDAAVRQALSQLRIRYKEALIKEVRESVGNEEDVDSELEFLIGMFRG